MDAFNAGRIQDAVGRLANSKRSKAKASVLERRAAYLLTRTVANGKSFSGLL